uniref:FLZ-type domain-containing protein n=1 Tax=Nelumbo nucifera TaxID=4432 RepID=A0A822ZP76_NELNU|nr:TPA_asm: hypothetical protein HUJ06_002956 [Nelumbo nucifera]
MLRKRSRSLQKDQSKSHIMPDCASESGFQSDVSGQKHKGSSFFSVPGLFVGFGSKGLSDSESARSPTSPLDYRIFSGLGNPFRSPRSCSDGPQKSWDCSKVGLSIVDSLNDESKPSGKVLRSSESKSILFGSQMKMNIPSPRRHLEGSVDSIVAPRSLPKSFVPLPHTLIKIPLIEIQLEPMQIGKVRSCLSDSGRSSPPWDFSRSPSPLTNLANGNINSNVKDIWAEQKTIQSGSPPIISGVPNLDNSLGMKPSSLPISIGSGHGFMGSLSASDIELSEDYTCVISHGPNPRTTHIFGDCILECHINDLINCSKKEQGIGSPRVEKRSDGSVPYPSNDFLSFCYSCKKKLDEGKDIFMYRLAQNLLFACCIP